MTAKSTGRPPKLTPELQEILCKVLMSGAFIGTAAGMVGVDRATVHRWLRRGAKKKRGRYWDFHLAVQRAQAQAELRDVLRIDRAAETDWRAAAFRLGRRFPKRWGKCRELGLETKRTARQTTRDIRDLLALTDSMAGLVEPARPEQTPGGGPPIEDQEESA